MCQSYLYSVGIQYLLKQKQNHSNSPLYFLWVGNVLKGIINSSKEAFVLEMLNASLVTLDFGNHLVDYEMPSQGLLQSNSAFSLIIQ